jgi:hypothetical protein
MTPGLGLSVFAQCGSWTSDGMFADVVRASLGQDCGCTVIQSERFDALRPFPVVVLAHDRAVSDPVDDAHGLRDVRAAGRAPRGERDARDNAIAEVDHRLRRVRDLQAPPNSRASVR